MRETRPLGLAGADRLLRTKLLTPRHLSNNVPRPRIDTCLDRGLEVPLMLVTAPAGFGKTTAVAGWIRARGIQAAWLSLDAGDNDPVRFWRYAVAALAGLQPGLGAGFSAMLRSATSPAWETGLSVLIDALSDLPGDDVVLVLDDYHVVDEPVVHEGLSFLLRYAPSQLHLVVASRVEPDLPQLPRLRAAGQVVELTDRDLRFLAEEQASFYWQRGIELDSAEAERLHARTAGWAAGMQMIALSLRGARDQSRAIEQFQGSDRNLSDYFMAEVFGGLAQAEQDLMLKTSVLDRLSGPLCDTLTGRRDGTAVLARLADRGAFLACVDKAGGWYVCHQLYAEFLQGLLAQRHPGEAAALCSRAGQWCEAHGLDAEAVEYYLQGGQQELALGLIERMAADMLGRGETATLWRWLSSVPQELLDARTRLMVMLAWAAVAAGRQDEAAEWLARAEASPAAVSPPRQDGAGSVELDRAMLKMVLAVGRLDVPATLHWLTEAGREQGEVSALVQGLAFETAEPTLMGGPWGWFGHLRHVEQSLERGDYLRLKGPGSPSAQRGYTFVLLGEVLCEWNRLDPALHSLAQGIGEAERAEDSVSLVAAFFALARVSMARGDLPGALAAATEAERQVRELGRLDWLPVVSALKARLHILGGDMPLVDEWLGRCRLDVYDRLSVPRAYEHVTLARALLGKGRGEEAVFLLERLLTFAESERCLPGMIETANLLAMALHAVGRTRHGVELLRENLARGRENGYLRIFVDEGAPLRTLLRRLGHCRGEEAEFVRRLSALLRTSPLRGYQGLVPTAPVEAVDALTARELAVLRLLAAGFDNRQIAAELDIAPATVKVHLSHIYAKLHAAGRQDALHSARQLGMLR